MNHRTLYTEFTFNASVQYLWEMWSNPNHIAQWWGPKGFTNTIKIMDFKEGGEWLFTMHAPDGTNFPNSSVYKEIVPHHKIVFEHFNPHFITTVLFTSLDNQTHLSWSMEFDTEEMFQIIVKTHKADDGQRENIEKLNAYIHLQQIK